MDMPGKAPVMPGTRPPLPRRPAGDQAPRRANALGPRTGGEGSSAAAAATGADTRCKCTNEAGQFAFAVLRTVGESNTKGNAGREFYACQGGSKGCGFFKWNQPRQGGPDDRAQKRRRTAQPKPVKPAAVGSTHTKAVDNPTLNASGAVVHGDVKGPPRPPCYIFARAVLSHLLEAGGWEFNVFREASIIQCAASRGAFDFQFGEPPDSKKVVVAWTCDDGGGAGRCLVYADRQAPDYLVVVDSLGDRAYLVPAASFVDRQLRMDRLPAAAISVVVLANLRV